MPRPTGEQHQSFLKYLALGNSRNPADSYVRRAGACPGSPSVSTITVVIPDSLSQASECLVRAVAAPRRYESGSTAII